MNRNFLFYFSLTKEQLLFSMEFLTRLFATNLLSLFFAHLSLLLQYCFLPTFLCYYCFLPTFLYCYCFFGPPFFVVMFFTHLYLLSFFCPTFFVVIVVFCPPFCDNPVFAHHIVVIVFCTLFFFAHLSLLLLFTFFT